MIKRLIRQLIAAPEDLVAVYQLDDGEEIFEKIHYVAVVEVWDDEELIETEFDEIVLEHMGEGTFIFSDARCNNYLGPRIRKADL